MDKGDIESQHVVGETSGSVEMKDLSLPLLDSIERMCEETIRQERPLKSECCIYRVPDKLRKLNEATYTPHVLSIGPFHRGKENLKTMEKQKVTYLTDFRGRANCSLEDLLVYIKKFEEKTRHCYAEIIELSSDEFTKMILLDGVFIIEFLLSRCSRRLVYDIDDDERTRLTDNVIYYDLILLENQIPFFVLEGLYNQASKFEDRPPSFLELACLYFDYYNNRNTIFPRVEEVKHFTDLLRIFQQPPSPWLHPGGVNREKGTISKYASATELHKAGIKFRRSDSKCFLDMEFNNGVLEIPLFTIEDGTEIVVKNLMALEQCHYPNNTYICDCYFLMASLIKTEKDVDLLVQNDIFLNRLRDNDAVATLFNNPGIQIQFRGDNFCFSELLDKLKAYYKTPWEYWKETLQHDYFNTPWKTASTMAAIILLVLTFIQTVCSIISLLEKK